MIKKNELQIKKEIKKKMKEKVDSLYVNSHSAAASHIETQISYEITSKKQQPKTKNWLTV